MERYQPDIHQGLTSEQVKLRKKKISYIQIKHHVQKQSLKLSYVI